MLKSMTGYGRFEGIISGRYIVLEMRSVNHKFFEFSSRITRGYMFLEDKLKSYMQSKISRGKLDIFLQIEAVESTDVSITVNHSLVSKYKQALEEIISRHNIDDRVSLSQISRYPDIFVVSRTPEDEDEIWETVKQAADIALESFLKMRKDEGCRLKNDILQKAENIMESINKVEMASPETVNTYRERLIEKINTVLTDGRFDEQRVLTEVAIMADKISVDEELVRLRSHFSQFGSLVDSYGPVGRKLDFLLQEMNREANTIGSKSLNSGIAHIVVDMKAELEKIREQIQNIE